MAGIDKQTRAALQAEIDHPGTDRHRRMMLKTLLDREPEADDDETPEGHEEFDIALAAARHRYEKDGGKWLGNATQGMLLGLRIMIERRVHKSFINHRDEIRALKKQVAELKEIVGHTAKSYVFYGGEFDLDVNYNENTIVRYKEIVYIALRDISAHRESPSRQGSGWARLF